MILKYIFLAFLSFSFPSFSLCQSRIIYFKAFFEDSSIVNQKIGLSLLNNQKKVVDFKELKSFSLDSFFIDNIDNTFFIIVDDFNYESDTIKCNSSAYIVNNIFVRPKNNNLINDIIVTSNAKLSNDTITYDVMKLNTSEVFDVGELINKVEDFKVQADGTILYKNQAIKRLMINGNVISNINYKKLIKLLRSNLVSQLQAITKYNDNRILSKFVNTNGVALNLILTKRGNILNKSLNVGLGLPKKYTNDVGIILLSKNIQTLSTISSNNIGESVGNLSLLNSTIKLFSYGIEEGNEKFAINNFMASDLLPLGNKFEPAFLPAAILNRNNTFVYQNGLNLRISKFLTTNVENFGNIDLNNFTSNSLRVFKINENVYDSINTSLKSNRKDYNNSTIIKLDFDGKKNIISNNLFLISKMKNLNYFSGITSGSVLDTLDDNVKNTSNELYYKNTSTYKLSSKSALFFKTEIYNGNYLGNYLNASRRFNFFFNDSSGWISNTNQFLDYNYKFSIFDLSLVNNFGKSQLKYGISHERNCLNLLNNIYFKSISQSENKNKLFNSAYFLYFSGNLLKINKLKVALDAKIGHNSLNNLFTNGVFKYKGFLGLLNLKNNYKLSFNNTFLLDFSFKKYLPNFNELLNSTVINSSDNFSTASLITNPITLLESILQYTNRKYFETKNTLIFSFNYNKKSIQRNINYFRGVTKSNYYLAEESFNTSFNTEHNFFSLFLKSKINFKFNLNLMKNSFLQNLLLNNFTSKNASLELKFIPNLLMKYLNCEIIYNLNYQSSKIKSSESENKFKVLKQQLQLTQWCKISERFKLFNEFSFYSFNNISPIYLLSSKLNYTPKSKLVRLELSSPNILNIKKYGYSLISQNGSENNYFNLAPNYWLLKARFIF